MLSTLIESWRHRKKSKEDDTPLVRGHVGRLALDAGELYSEQEGGGGGPIVWVTLLCVVTLVAWSAVTHIEEVARGDGKVIPSLNVQLVQSLDGGVVSEILVKEGDRVKRDQPLVRIEDIRADAQESEQGARLMSLRARAQRLQAESSGLERPKFDEDVLRAVPQEVDRENLLFDARRAERRASQQVIAGQIDQRQQEIREAQTRKDTAARALTLLEREVEVTRPLVKAGAASEVELMRLERELVRNRGEKDSAEAAIERVSAGLREARQRLRESEEGARSRTRQELNEVASEVSRLREGMRGLTDRVNKTVLKAPVDGIVKTLHAKTVGGVVQPGKEVVEIVPVDDKLLLEARIQPRDIANLHIGQKATVRLSAYDFAIHGGLKGALEHVSADTVTDEKGNAFYRIRVSIPKEELLSGGLGGHERPVLPGMTASVDILTGERTLLTYLLKPILRAQQVAFTER